MLVSFDVNLKLKRKYEGKRTGRGCMLHYLKFFDNFSEPTTSRGFRSFLQNLRDNCGFAIQYLSEKMRVFTSFLL